MTQVVTIKHNKPEPKPFVISRVPPLALDGMNALMRGQRSVRVPLRRKVLSVTIPGKRSVLVEDESGNVSLRYPDGRSRQGRDSWDDIIALDGDEPAADEGLVRVGSLEVGAAFRHCGYWRSVVATQCYANVIECSVFVCGARTFIGVSEMVRPLRPGESLDIRVVAS